MCLCGQGRVAQSEEHPLFNLAIKVQFFKLFSRLEKNDAIYWTKTEVGPMTYMLTSFARQHNTTSKQI